MKFNSTGALLWQRGWTGNNSNPCIPDAANALAVDASGNAYVTGYTIQNPKTGEDVFLMKFDADGNLLWERSWGGPYGDVGHGIALDAYGEVYVTGDTRSFGAHNMNTILLKFSSNGSLIWQQYWGDLSDNSGSAIAVDSLGNTYVSGFTARINSAFVLKFNSTGSLQWQETWGSDGSTNNAATAMLVDSSGYAYVTGYENAYNRNGQYIAGIPIMKLDPDGMIVWQRMMWQQQGGYCCSMSGNGLVLDRSGNLLLTGQNSPYGSSNGVLLLRLSPQGDLEWEAAGVGSSSDTGRSITSDQSGHLIVVGTANEGPPYTLTRLYNPIVTDNLTLSPTVGKINASNGTTAPLNLGIYPLMGIQNFSGQSGTFILKVEPPQPSPPSPPLALVAQADQYNISLSWAPPEFEGGFPITGYRVFRGLSSASETAYANTSKTLSYIDASAKNGVTYYYYVKAVNSLGESDASNEGVATAGATPGLTGFVPTDSPVLFGASVVVAALTVFTLFRRRRRVRPTKASPYR